MDEATLALQDVEYHLGEHLKQVSIRNASELPLSPEQLVLVDWLETKIRDNVKTLRVAADELTSAHDTKKKQLDEVLSDTTAVEGELDASSKAYMSVTIKSFQLVYDGLVWVLNNERSLYYTHAKPGTFQVALEHYARFDGTLTRFAEFAERANQWYHDTKEWSISAEKLAVKILNRFIEFKTTLLLMFAHKQGFESRPEDPPTDGVAP